MGVFLEFQREVMFGNFYVPTTPEMHFLSPKHPRELSDLSERNQTKPKKEISERITAEILKCVKTVWCAGSNELTQEFMYLSRIYYWKRWQRSRDILKVTFLRLVFVDLDNSNIPRNFQSMLESGIWRRLEEEQWARDLTGREKKAREHEPDGTDPVALSGSIFTIFILCGVILGLSSVCLGIEVCRKMFLCITGIYDGLKYHISL
ncbi:hypothetical protein Fcan01_23305 [Folsomia candida]|uniref:Uncharacterized protein n=1 Tax=Folsomia candida TaxID=158441 RepID=A0A226DAB3_FOLCA|nr:hypothetical protein Fcan01_23305 [Folsomia candida]